MMLSRDDPYFKKKLIIGGTINTPSSLSLVKYTYFEVTLYGRRRRKKSLQLLFNT